MKYIRNREKLTQEQINFIESGTKSFLMSTFDAFPFFGNGTYPFDSMNYIDCDKLEERAKKETEKEIKIFELVIRYGVDYLAFFVFLILFFLTFLILKGDSYVGTLLMFLFLVIYQFSREYIIEKNLRRMSWNCHDFNDFNDFYIPEKTADEAGIKLGNRNFYIILFIPPIFAILMLLIVGDIRWDVINLIIKTINNRPDIYYFGIANIILGYFWLFNIYKLKK